MAYYADAYADHYRVSRALGSRIVSSLDCGNCHQHLVPYAPSFNIECDLDQLVAIHP
jgi:hypothetical protein